METQIKTSEVNNSVTLIDPRLVPNLTSEYFNASYWKSLDAITGSAKGRGTTWFFTFEQNEYVLRHYHRGGMIGRLLNDEYLYLGKKQTRAVKEFHLLHTMYHELGLPVPQPVSAQIIISKCIYRADIITTRIQNSQSVVESLKNKSFEKSTWSTIGATIRRFHDAGIYHHDLNANNILIDSSEKIWLIDFDQGRFEQKNSNWKQSNLSRLHRSFLKEKNRHPELHWSPENWDFLTQGYNKAS